MLKKVNRISLRDEFSLVLNEGKMIQTPLFGVKVYEAKEGKAFGFVVSKKISKRAVDRNKIKRRLAEAIRLRLDGFKDGTRMIFLVRKAILGVGMEEINYQINKLIN